MRRRAIFLAATVLFLSASGAALAADRSHNTLIYRVDSVSARIKGHRLTISAKGAVRSGGWENPHLRVLPHTAAEAGALKVEFVASPPPPGGAVIQALLPVSATLSVGLPHYATTKVTVTAETNAVTTPITVKK